MWAVLRCNSSKLSGCLSTATTLRLRRTLAVEHRKAADTDADGKDGADVVFAQFPDLVLVLEDGCYPNSAPTSLPSTAT
jgi:hypothetical protein